MNCVIGFMNREFERGLRKSQGIKFNFRCFWFGHNYKTNSNFPVMSFKCKKCGVEKTEMMF